MNNDFGRVIEFTYHDDDDDNRFLALTKGQHNGEDGGLIGDREEQGFYLKISEAKKLVRDLNYLISDLEYTKNE